MKFTKIFIASGFVLGMLTPSAFAAVDSQQQLQQQLQQVTTETIALQKEVAGLQKELAQMKRSKSTTTTTQSQKSNTYSRQAQATHMAGSKDNRTHLVYGYEEQEYSNPNHKNYKTNKDYYVLGTYVTTSPYLGLRSAYNASDLIVNLPTMNEDLRFLEQRQELQERLPPDEVTYIKRPLIELSGKVESQIVWQSPFNGPDQSDIDLSAAELDVLAEASEWALAFISINYDDSPLDPILAGNGDIEGNSRLFLNRGFLTIGDLTKFPAYFTIGQMYVPFGDYGSYLVSSPLTQILGRVRTRAAVLGYSQNGVYAAGYGFSGNTIATDRSIDDYGFNLGYKFGNEKVKANIGAGLLNDIAESQGMQDNGNGLGSFQGFGASSQTEDLHNRVMAGDLHARMTYGNADFIAEYISAMKHFDAEDLSFNADGAQPRAFHVEGAYNFNVFSKPSSFALAYDESWQALALQIPKNSYRAVFNISLWKNTIESLEYRYDVNYADTDNAGGPCINTADFLGPATFCSANAQGSRQNTVVAQIGVYF